MASFIAWSLIVGGVPCLVVLASLWYMSYRVTLPKFMTWWRMAPFATAFAFGVWGLAVLLIRNRMLDWSTSGFLAAWFIGGVYCVVLGYAYIALAGLGYLLLERFGFVREDHWLSAQPET